MVNNIHVWNYKQCSKCNPGLYHLPLHLSTHTTSTHLVKLRRNPLINTDQLPTHPPTHAYLHEDFHDFRSFPSRFSTLSVKTLPYVISVDAGDEDLPLVVVDEQSSDHCGFSIPTCHGENQTPPEKTARKKEGKEVREGKRSDREVKALRVTNRTERHLSTHIRFFCLSHTSAHHPAILQLQHFTRDQFALQPTTTSNSLVFQIRLRTD